MFQLGCVVLLLLFTCVFYIQVFIKGEISVRLVLLEFTFFGCVAVLFAFLFFPKGFIRWDLIEHLKLVDLMRADGLEYALSDSFYKDLPAYNLFAFFISLLPKSCKNLLTAIPLAIIFCISGYLCKDCFLKQNTKISGRATCFAVFVWITTFGLKLAISGIRCTLAVSLAVLGVYWEYIKKEHRYRGIVLYIVAALIHNFAIMVLLTRILAFVQKTSLLLVGSLFVSTILPKVARFVISNVNSQYLAHSFQRILETVDEMSFTNALRYFEASTLLIYLIFIMTAVYAVITAISAKSMAHRTNDSGVTNRMVSWALTVACLVVGLSFNYLYLERSMYVLAYVLLLLIPYHNQWMPTNRASNFFLGAGLVFLFFFNDIYIFFVNSLGFYFLAF